MPWTPKDAARHTKKAKTGKLARQWAAVANNVRTESGDEGAAVRAANGVIAGYARRKRRGK